MKKIILAICCLMITNALSLHAQLVSNDNEDEVNKIDQQAARFNNYVPGQVLVKFSDRQRVKVNRIKGKFSSTSVASVTDVMQKYGVEEMEQILPGEKAGRPLRKARAYNGDMVEEKDLSQLYQLKLGEKHLQEVHQIIDELKELDEVEFAEPNYLLYTLDDEVLNDNYEGNPMVTGQWYLDSYGVKELWTKPVINPTRPVIAILDTGVDITHPDLVDNIWTNTKEEDGEEGYDNDNNGFKNDVHGWDFINNTPNMRDNNMHGTHVAGIAAASNNDIGIVGANPRAYIMPITVMQSDGTGDVATIIKGIDYAVKNGANILNFSLGTYANSSALRQALARAYQNCVIVAAAGNDGRCCYSSHYPDIHQFPIPAPMFPAAYSFVLGVQATAQDGGLASFSNYDDDGPTYSCESSVKDPDGFNYELKAPGVDMLSTIPGGKYKNLNGTSMASPLVAGSISALLMAKEYDTQEILWGDLLHSSNIAEAYNITERPAELDLMRLEFRDRKELSEETEEDYSNDGRIDAGETVDIYPIIRTTFGEASNIKMHLEMGDEFEDSTVVEIFTDEENKADFGWHLDEYGKNVSLNPLRLKVNDDVADGRHIKMKMIATCDESNDTFEKDFVLIVDNVAKIGGLIDKDTTLTADKTWLVVKNLAIPEGITLKIEPGTRIEFEKNTEIYCEGVLDANGKPGKMIVFTDKSGDYWSGIRYPSSEREWIHGVCYTDSSETIFSSIFSDKTPIERYFQNIYFNPNTAIYNYLAIDIDNTSDLSFNYKENYQSKSNIFYVPEYRRSSYCIFENIKNNGSASSGYGFNCFLKNSYETSFLLSYNSNIIDCRKSIGGNFYGLYNNIINNSNTDADWSILYRNNYFNNTTSYINPSHNSQYVSSPIYISNNSSPSYLGTSREDIILPYCYDIRNGLGYAQVDLSNMRTTPVSEAHGIVWKVVVNGYDAQDEYEDLPPLGIGRHKFEVYFNRPMNKEVAPNISFGVRDPYTQNGVAEDGSWNEEGTFYTAYITITGKTKSDGVNRIYVYGAEDDEFFEIPYEKTRFNVNIQAAGSLATGFAAEPGLGRVNLTWNNENNDFADAMGFNVYRYNEVQKILPPGWRDDGSYSSTQDTIMVSDTIRVNTDILDINATTYTDYDVTPGETYYYYYKVLSTDLQEYDVSNVVACTPLTSTLGDANGSGEVDVADVITTVNYASNMNPKPFIFEAADMNSDNIIDIIDVVKIILQILHPETAGTTALAEATAVYTIKDDILYVESPVALGGIQVQLNSPKHNDPEVLESLKGFEHASAWLTDEDYLFLAYNMNGKTLPAGKHAILKLGEGGLRGLRLSDAHGHNIGLEPGNATSIIETSVSTKLNAKGIYNLNGQKVAGKAEDLKKLPRGIYIVDGQKVAK